MTVRDPLPAAAGGSPAATILANVVIFISTIVAMVILSWQLAIVAA